jgi:hypothetical protein
MTLKIDNPNHAIDQFGYLVRLEDETEEQYITRTAEALHAAGLSANDPADVVAQYDEPLPPEPPIEGDEGEHPEQQKEQKREEQRQAWMEEWKQRRAARWEEVGEAAKAEREALIEARAKQSGVEEHSEAAEGEDAPPRTRKEMRADKKEAREHERNA